MKHIYTISQFVKKCKMLFAVLFTVSICSLHTSPSFAQAQLFGLTSGGGADYIGTLFRYDPPTTYQDVKQSMRNLAPGAFTGYVELTDGGNGKFYGMTINGGMFDLGVIFEWDPVSNIYVKKIDFASANGGGFSPMGSLTMFNGKFYGMTSSGGTNGIGSIFEWDPISNVLTKKRDLDMINGGFPFGSLSLYAGKFYGMTSVGGGFSSGTLFEWDPITNVYTTQLDFSPTNGERPYGTLLLQGSLFYGTTKSGGVNGCGTIFEWDPLTGIYVKKIDMTSNGGSGSFGALTYLGNKFYGTTDSGGVNNKGVIFEWDPITNIYTKKIDLSSVNGANGHGRMSINAGKFYGLTSRGGASNRGVIFEWNPISNIYIKKIDLTTNTGNSPFGTMVLKSGKFYGVTFVGGTPDKGVIFEWDPISNVYSKKVELNYSLGSGPYGSLVLNGTKMYGMTVNGGNNDKGVIFEYDTVANIYTKKIDMSVALGCNPYGSLALSGSKYYGMTSKGGANNLGVIFEWDPISNIYTKKIDLSIANGCEPWGSLTLSGGKFYGMMQTGGANNEGVIFEWDPISNVYTKKIDLADATGRTPFGSLTLNNGKFYGMTAFGGATNKGVIFEWDPANNTYTKKIDLVDTLGSNPFGSLAVNNNMFYGMTYQGGINFAGVIFDWNPVTNVYRDRSHLNPIAGKNPYGSLARIGSKYYGMTSRGGAFNQGCIFEWDTLSNVYSMTKNLSSANGNIPYGDFLVCPCLVPVQPASISGPTNICELTTNTYSVPAIPGVMNYTWTLPNGWSGSSTTNSIVALAAFVGGNITVKANDGCGTSTVQTLAVVVNQVPQTPGIISGSQSVCNGSTNTYSVAPVAGANSYIWTLPNGWTGTSVTNTINATAGPNSGNIFVKAYNNACGSSPNISLYVMVTIIPPVPFSIGGAPVVCQGSTHTYSIPAVPGATSYTWTLPNGWTGSSITNSIAATASANSGIITVTANNSCGASPQKTVAVTVNPTYTLNVNLPICQGDSVLLGGAYRKTAGTYNNMLMTTKGCDSLVITTVIVNPLPIVTLNLNIKGICIDALPYTLTGGMPLGGTYSGTGVTNGVFYPAVAGLGLHQITYTYTDPNTGCSKKAYNFLQVNPLPPIPFINSNGDTFTSSASYGNQWYLNGNPINGANNQIYVSNANGNYMVCFTDSDACKSCSSVLSYTLFGIEVRADAAHTIQVYPNPVSDMLTLITSNAQSGTILLFNTLGELVFTKQVTTEKTVIDMQQLPTGMYILQVRSESGISNVRVVKE